MNRIILDVREKDEYDAERIPGSLHFPLSQLTPESLTILSALNAQQLLIVCRSGKRSELAREALVSLGLAQKFQLESFPGGLLEWKKQGKPVLVAKRGYFPIMRQVQMITGAIILLCVCLSIWVSPAYIWGAAVIGFGLSIAGLTGVCGMAELLSKMPWNQIKAKNVSDGVAHVSADS